MKVNWLWDIRADEREAKRILKNPKHPEFYIFAQRLFSRVGDGETAFAYMDKDEFCRVWPGIRQRMMRDKWLAGKIAFWDGVYKESSDAVYTGVSDLALRMDVAKRLRELRIKQGYSQKELAEKLGVIQQYVSKIEKGRENFSLGTLSRIAGILRKKLILKIS